MLNSSFNHSQKDHLYTLFPKSKPQVHSLVLMLEAPDQAKNILEGQQLSSSPTLI